jgi:hypothetical protein
MSRLRLSNLHSPLRRTAEGGDGPSGKLDTSAKIFVEVTIVVLVEPLKTKRRIEGTIRAH